jgi:hypothetical protein
MAAQFAAGRIVMEHHHRRTATAVLIFDRHTIKFRFHRLPPEFFAFAAADNRPSTVDRYQGN